MMSAAVQVETFVSSQPRFAGRVGLLAGAGRFPIYFAEAAKRRGIEVVCVAIRDHADVALRDLVDGFHWSGIAKLGRMVRCFKREKVDCVVMAGKVEKAQMFTPFRILRYMPDWRMVRVWLSKQRRDNKDDSMLLAVIEEFRKEGIGVASALEICPELLVQAGTPTKRKPSTRERADIAFGWVLAKEMGRLDVGQSVSVKESAVLAVEAIEGTDQAILRAGKLCPAGGFTVVKVAKPSQDMRFDVPTVGVTTIETMKKAGASVLAIEADKTILMDADATVALANKHGISIVALTADQATLVPEAA